MLQQRGTGVGLVIAVVSAVTFGAAGTLGASLLDQGWSPGAAVGVRVLLGAVLLTPFALWSLRGRFRLLRAGWRSVVALGLLGVAGAQLAFFSAVQTLSVGVALLLEYSAVVLVVLWLWVRQGRRPHAMTVVGAAVAVGGLVLVLDVLSGARVDGIGVLWGLAAAVGLAGYFLVSARTEDAVPPLALAWGALVVGGTVLSAAGAVRVLPVEVSTADVTLLDAQVSWLVPVVGLGLVSAAVAYATGVLAARLLGATLASFVGLSEVLFAVLIAWVALGQDLSPVQLVGGGLVLTGIALVQADEARRARRDRRRARAEAAATAAAGAPTPVSDDGRSVPLPVG